VSDLLGLVSPSEWTLIVLWVAASAYVHGIIGFGMGLLVAPVVYLIDPLFVPAPLMINGFLMVTVMAWRERSAIFWPGVWWAVLGCTLGTAGGAVLLRGISATGFSIALGLLLLFAVVLSLVSGHLRPARTNSFGAGALSGFMGVITSVGGPPVALLYQNEAGKRIRATLSAYFVLAGLISFAGLRWAGRLNGTEVAYALLLLPGVAIGYGVSMVTARRLSERVIRPAILLLCAVGAAAILARALWPAA
jgi:uncharacterized membrane protein YfcA